ncbi:hypothetical protein LY76DRAFT_603783 [Colletotrichum caudatum]|nr:hypothetical protein LY76DRAFT_603783 [Colletotrichum caudatum]
MEAAAEGNKEGGRQARMALESRPSRQCASASWRPGNSKSANQGDQKEATIHLSKTRPICTTNIHATWLALHYFLDPLPFGWLTVLSSDQPSFFDHVPTANEHRTASSSNVLILPSCRLVPGSAYNTAPTNKYRPALCYTTPSRTDPERENGSLAAFHRAAILGAKTYTPHDRYKNVHDTAKKESRLPV